MFTIRPAREDEREQIKALVREGGINPLGLDWSRFVLAVDESGTVVGCGQIKPHRDGSRELASIAVTAVHRKQGAAGDIIRTLLQGHDGPLWLTCMENLVPFYKRYGFTQVTAAAEMPTYFRRAYRFVNVYVKLRPGQPRLAVMTWPGAAQVSFAKQRLNEIR